MKTPYLYEYFSIAEGDLIAPERSLFGANISLNRQIGAMLLGELFDSRISYAVGAVQRSSEFVRRLQQRQGPDREHQLAPIPRIRAVPGVAVF